MTRRGASMPPPPPPSNGATGKASAPTKPAGISRARAWWGGGPVGGDVPPPPHAPAAVVVQLGGHRGLARSRGRLRRLGGRAGGCSGLSVAAHLRRRDVCYSGLSFAALTTSRRRS